MDIGLLPRTAAPLHDWQYLVLHHSGGDQGSVESLDALHRLRRDQFGNPWAGIGYHFVIGNGQGMIDGRVAATFRWQQQLHGAHARSRRHNRLGLGICLIGDFEEQPPTPRQLSSTQKLLELLLTRLDISRHNILRHSDIAATRCPGRLLPFEELIDSLADERAMPVGAGSGVRV